MKRLECTSEIDCSVIYVTDKARNARTNSEESENG